MRDASKFVLDESGKLLIEPYMEELPDLFVSYFKAILMVGHGIPRLEYYMSQGETPRLSFGVIIWAQRFYIFVWISPENGKFDVFFVADKHQLGYLHTIDENHIDMLMLFDAVRKIVAANQMGPTIYLYPIYLYYSSLVSDRIKAMTERIFQQKIIPNLPVTITFIYIPTLLFFVICSLDW